MLNHRQLKRSGLCTPKEEVLLDALLTTQQRLKNESKKVGLLESALKRQKRINDDLREEIDELSREIVKLGTEKQEKWKSAKKGLKRLIPRRGESGSTIRNIAADIGKLLDKVEDEQAPERLAEARMNKNINKNTSSNHLSRAGREGAREE